MTSPPPRIFVSAGEPSGDQHAADVVSALRRRWPDAVIEGFGGPAMAAAGATLLYHMDDYTVMGLAEIVAKIPAHVRLLRLLRDRFNSEPYDLVIPVDYPGFHLRLAAAAHSRGIRVLYYIPPQLWAWRPGRARRLAEVTDRLAVVLPFEEEFFARLGLAATYVGHPIVDHSWRPERAAARESLGVTDGARVLAIFPGSREQEVRYHWDVFREVGRRLLEEGACDRVLVAGVRHGVYADPGPLEILPDRAPEVLAAADAAVVKSGTTTLETALAKVPMVVVYRMHPFTHAVGRRLTRLRHYSLVNLVAGSEVVPELIQGAATAERIASAVRPLLDPASAEACAQRQGLARVIEQLGPPGAAERVAELAAQLTAQ